MCTTGLKAILPGLDVYLNGYTVFVRAFQFRPLCHYAVWVQREPLLSFTPFWPNWHQVWLTVPSICSGSQGRERWLHHAASPQQLPDLPCCIWVWRWAFLGFFFSPSLLYYTLWQRAAAVGASFFLLLWKLWLSLQAAAGWMLWSWRWAAPVSTSWRPKPGERQTSARLPSLPISSTCCRPARSMTRIFYSKQPTQPRAKQKNSIANPCCVTSPL